MSWKAQFQRFLTAAPGRLHFAAHSHHPWPDVSLEAHQQAWHDAARLADDKWELVFGTVWPEAQAEVARELSLPTPQSLVFASNTHELTVRLLSCLAVTRRAPLRILTTDSEFHSFERQSRRLEEAGLAQVERVPVEPLDSFAERLWDAARRPRDVIFLSQVFFNSGAIAGDLTELVGRFPSEPLVVIDGYHGFCAVPTDLSRVGARAAFLAGGYKYAMAGEGACFLHLPPGQEMRPIVTGWFAAFGGVEEKLDGPVPFAPGAMALAGATFDPSGLYRLRAVLRWRRECMATTQAARAHAQALQRQFLAGLAEAHRLPFRLEDLVVVDPLRRGQFLTFRTPHARALATALRAKQVVVDAREDRLRIGFGIYQDSSDVEALLGALAELRGPTR